MRQLKRIIYFSLLNIIISALTIWVVLSVWDRTHPALPVESTPEVVVVTATSAAYLPLVSNPPASETPAPIQAPPTRIQPSPTLELIEYIVQSGDTLGAIAQRFDVSLADIMIVNDLTNPDAISVGQLLYIPTSPLPGTPLPPAATDIPLPTLTPTPGASPTATATLTGLEPQVIIHTVTGVGDLAVERVMLQRTGDGELSLAGWRMVDEDGHTYLFPVLILYRDGAVNVHTAAGQNTVVDLYWGMTSAAWSRGEVVTLYDAQNTVRATYTIP